MTKCDCGAETTRITLTMTGGGKLLDRPTSICPSCAPESFQEPFYAVSERKIVAEHIARPHLYTQLPNGEFVAKDIVLQGIQDVMDTDPDHEKRQAAIARKRATRRTQPLSPTEIEQAERKWRPIVRAHQAEQERLAQQDRAYTDAVIEKYARQGHEKSKIFSIN
jgi:hypothetical protein